MRTKIQAILTNFTMVPTLNLITLLYLVGLFLASIAVDQKLHIDMTSLHLISGFKPPLEMILKLAIYQPSPISFICMHILAKFSPDTIFLFTLLKALTFTQILLFIYLQNIYNKYFCKFWYIFQAIFY